MSTRINIAVDSGGLSKRNRQQVDVNRTSRLLNDARDDATQEGQRQLVTGERLPSAGSSSRIQRIAQEPAANRKGGVDVLLIPQGNYVNFGGALTGIKGNSKRGPVTFSRNIYDITPAMFQGTVDGELKFLEQEGPENSNALRLNPPTPPETSFIEWGQPFNPDLPTPPLGTPWFSLVDTRHTQVLRYALVQQRYDGIGSWLNNTTYGEVFSPVENEVTTINGEIIVTNAQTRNNSYLNVTHEFMIDSTGGYIPLSGKSINGSSRFNIVEVRVDGLSINLTTREEVINDFITYFVQRPGVSGLDAVSLPDFTGEYVSTVLVRSGLVFKEGIGSIPVATVDPSQPPNVVLYEDTYTPSAAPYTHCAMVRSVDAETNALTWSVYLNGNRLFTAVLSPEWNVTFGQRPVGAQIALTSKIGNSPSEYILPAIHGYRFTPRALYTGPSINPPKKITRFA